jgi:hypothetical protein
MEIQCSYCGVQANALDHIRPVSYDHVDRKSVKYTKDLTVPICNECNSNLSNVWLLTISERAGFLIEKYNKKYKKILKQPNWEEWELDELGENMLKIVLSNIKKKEYIIKRLNFLMLVYNEQDLTPQDIWVKYPEDAYGKFKKG